jgi:hypothetical protein
MAPGGATGLRTTSAWATAERGWREEWSRQKYRMTTQEPKSGSGEHWRRPVQILASPTITLGLTPNPSDCYFNASDGEACLGSEAGTITGLDGADAQILSGWFGRVSAVGIDSILDLSARPWMIDGPQAIMGIFEKQKDQASWLILRCCSGWMLIDCRSGFISDVSAALDDVLMLIGEPAIGSHADLAG